jgi:ribosome biogenesis protein Tsr3
MTVKLFYIYQISNEILEKYKKKRNNQRIENIRQRFINL